MKKSCEIVNRKGLKEDRIAICPKFGCKYLKKVKPLKFGFIGFHKYPKCPKHKLSLVFVDEFVGNFLNSVNLCIFDTKNLIPKALIDAIKTKSKKDKKVIVNSWLYCTPMGRGIKIIPNYLNSLSTAYLKVLSKKQKKAINDGKYIKKNCKMLKVGFEKIVTVYSLFINEYREKSALLYNSKYLTQIS
jgi:hypothetical protein